MRQFAVKWDSLLDNHEHRHTHAIAWKVLLGVNKAILFLFSFVFFNFRYHLQSGMWNKWKMMPSLFSDRPLFKRRRRKKTLKALQETHSCVDEMNSWNWVNGILAAKLRNIYFSCADLGLLNGWMNAKNALQMGLSRQAPFAPCAVVCPWVIIALKSCKWRKILIESLIRVL